MTVSEQWLPSGSDQQATLDQQRNAMIEYQEIDPEHYKELLQDLKTCEAYGKQVDAELYEVRRWLKNAEELLEFLGYRRCDIAACNCSSYHLQNPEPEV